jgi:hypothetical protein
MLAGVLFLCFLPGFFVIGIKVLISKFPVAVEQIISVTNRHPEKN